MEIGAGVEAEDSTGRWSGRRLQVSNAAEELGHQVCVYRGPDGSMRVCAGGRGGPAPRHYLMSA